MNVNVAPKTTEFTVTPLTGSIGAAVRGMDVARLYDAMFARLRAAFLDHCMLVLPEQFVTPETQLAFAARWGEISITPMLTTYVEGYPGLLRLFNRGKAELVTEKLALGFLVPGEAAGDHHTGGERASGDGRRHDVVQPVPVLRPAVAHDEAHARGLRASSSACAWAAPTATGRHARAVHPIVRTHPETGRKALYVGHPRDGADDRRHDCRGKPAAARLPLRAFGPTPTTSIATCGKQGDVVMWDNRCTMHYAIHDYGTQRAPAGALTKKGGGCSDRRPF